MQITPLALRFAICAGLSIAVGLLSDNGRLRTIAAENSADLPPMAKQISGVVLLPDGKPAAAATVIVIGLPWQGMYRINKDPLLNDLIAQGSCDDQGRFDLTELKTSPTLWQEVRLVVTKAGYAVGWLPIDVYHQRLNDVHVQLQTANEVRGRLLTPAGEPAVGVTVQLNMIDREPNDYVTYMYFPRGDPINNYYPSRFQTDSQGEFAIGQLPPGVMVNCSVATETYIEQRWTWHAGDSQVHEITLERAQIITGTVVAGDTSQPLAHARLRANRRQLAPPNGKLADTHWSVLTESDEQGRFRFGIPRILNPLQPIQIRIEAPLNTPYFGNVLKIDQQTDLTKELRIELPRGVEVTGHVTEQPGGRPVAYAGIGYVQRQDNANLKGISLRGISTSDTVTDEHGYFRMGVPEGAGNLVVWQGPSTAVLHSSSLRQLLTGKAGFDSNVFEVFAQIGVDVPAGAKALTAEIPLDLGVAIQGKVVGVDVTTPERVKVTYRGDFRNYTDVFSGDHAWPVYDGHLVIRGIPPDGELLAYLIDPIGKQGKMLHVHGSDAGAAVERDVGTVRLGKVAIYRHQRKGRAWLHAD